MSRSIFRFLRSRKAGRIESLAELRARASEIRAALREAKLDLGEAVSPDDIARALAACGERIDGIVARTLAALEALEPGRVAAGDYFRLLQATYRTFRRPKVPDWLNTILTAMVFWLLEGSLAGAILIAEGRMDVPTGLAFGMAFAAINIILGLLIGYLPLRYLAYRSSINLSASDEGAGLGRGAVFIRILSALGLGAGLAAEAVLIYGAARLRALGTHEGVWDFTQIGFGATWDDALATIIAVLGICSVILAILKGYSGIDDPIPGYWEAYRQATADMDAAAGEIAQQAEDATEADCDRALERAEDALAVAQDALEGGQTRLSEIAHAIDCFNDDVRSAREAARSRARKKRGLVSFVTGRARAKPVRIDSGAFDALMLPGIDDEIEKHGAAHTAAITPLETAIAELEGKCQRCLAQIRAALAAFLSNAPNLDALFDDDDGEDDG